MPGMAVAAHQATLGFSRSGLVRSFTHCGLSIFAQGGNPVRNPRVQQGQNIRTIAKKKKHSARHLDNMQLVLDGICLTNFNMAQQANITQHAHSGDPDHLLPDHPGDLSCRCWSRTEVMISHQWAGAAHPDPKLRQFQASNPQGFNRPGME